MADSHKSNATGRSTVDGNNEAHPNMFQTRNFKIGLIVGLIFGLIIGTVGTVGTICVILSFDNPLLRWLITNLLPATLTSFTSTAPALTTEPQFAPPPTNGGAH
jgi:hypothetical protein